MKILICLLVGLPIGLAALIISDTWASGWFSCLIYITVASLIQPKNKTIKPTTFLGGNK